MLAALGTLRCYPLLCQKRFPCKSFVRGHQHLPACLSTDHAQKGLLLMKNPKTDLHKDVDGIAVPTAFHGLYRLGCCVDRFLGEAVSTKSKTGSTMEMLQGPQSHLCV